MLQRASDGWLVANGFTGDADLHNRCVGRVAPAELAEAFSASVDLTQGATLDDAPLVWIDCPGAEFTAAGARQFAAHLLNAADLVDEAGGSR